MVHNINNIPRQWHEYESLGSKPSVEKTLEYAKRAVPRKAFIDHWHKGEARTLPLHEASILNLEIPGLYELSSRQGLYEEEENGKNVFGLDRLVCFSSDHRFCYPVLDNARHPEDNRELFILGPLGHHSHRQYVYDLSQMERS